MTLAIRLEAALDRDTPVLALDLSEWHRILSVLDDPPDSLLEPRAVLIREATRVLQPELTDKPAGTLATRKSGRPAQPSTEKRRSLRKHVD